MAAGTQNFWDFESWGFFNLLAVLLIALLFANILKRKIGFLRKSLIPTSVLGGVLLLIPAMIYERITGASVFDTAFFGGNGATNLEVLTYHALALGFIAITFRPSKEKFNRERNIEIFNTGVTTVSTYLLQGVVGLGITMLWVLLFNSEFYSYAGVLLPFGFGQGTGQALNYGNLYESDYGFVGGKSFGLTVAALGFLSASFGGVIYLNIMRLKKKIKPDDSNPEYKVLLSEEVQAADEIPMNGSIDKLTFQFVHIFSVYFVTYLLMMGLGKLLPNNQALVYGFNFLFAVIITTIAKAGNTFLRKKKIINRQYISPFLMTRISGLFFDIMIIAGIAAIRLSTIKDYWGVLLTMAVAGAIVTYFYNRFVAKKLFGKYQDEQFLAMYGMLTGTASTGMILLREIDSDFSSPAADNLVYQNLPAIVFGFPMMFLGALAPKQPVLTFILLAAAFVVMNVLLFRKWLFKKKKK